MWYLFLGIKGVGCFGRRGEGIGCFGFIDIGSSEIFNISVVN